MEKRFGENQICSVGSTVTLKLKGAIKDLDRQFENDFSNANLMTAIIDEKDSTMLDLFKRSTTEPRLKQYIKQQSDIFKLLPTILNQPKTKSIHPCAMIIFPEVMTASQWSPMRSQNGLIVSEWDGGQMEDAGFLKEDILGIKQLDKFGDILEIIKNNGKEVPDIYNLPDDPEVYRYFGNGWNGDIFQMGSEGLTEYSKALKPKNINDLTAANALYRPGPMENHYHEIYVKCKNEGRKVEYLWGTEEITKNTYGLLCLSGESNIITKRGIVKLKDVKINDKVRNKSNNWDTVTDSFYSGKKETIRIRTTFGEELILTPDHKVMTQFGWKEAKDLNTSSDLIKGNWIGEEKFDDIDKDTALEHWLIGYYLAEGGGKCTPTIYVGSEDRTNEVLKVVKKVFPTSVPKVTFRKNKERLGGCHRIQVSFAENKNAYFSKDFKVNLMKKKLLEYGITNKQNVYTKRLPKNYSIHMLSGLFEGDGCFQNGIIRLANKELSYDLFLALQSYRIPCTYKEEGNVFTVSIGKNDKLKFRIIKEDFKGAKIYYPTNGLIWSSKPKWKSMRARYYNKNCNASYVSRDTISKFTEFEDVNHKVWGRILRITENEIIDTYDITVKDEHSFHSGGLIVHNCYQEQIMQVCQQVGGLSMREADDVRRAMGKKKASVLEGWKDIVKEGFVKKGCSSQEFNTIWSVMLEFAKYSFNLSHSAAYALTAYVGMYLKVNFPLEYWTVALDYANEKDTLKYLAEIFSAKKVKILPSDINGSGIEMISDMKSQNIFWGIGSIKGIGEDTALQVIAERDKNGDYTDFDDFHDRHSFTGSKVKKQTYEALISSGAFDRLYHIKNESERGNLIKDFRERYGVKIANKEKDCYTVGAITQKWWWLLKQKELTGLADVNYSEIASTMGIDTKFFTQIELNTKQGFGIFRLFGGYIVECKVSKSKKGKFARLTIEHNYKLFKLIVWSDEYMLYEKELTGCEKSIIIFSANLKYEDKWTKGNQLTLTNKSILKVLK